MKKKFEILLERIDDIIFNLSKPNFELKSSKIDLDKIKWVKSILRNKIDNINITQFNIIEKIHFTNLKSTILNIDSIIKQEITDNVLIERKLIEIKDSIKISWYLTVDFIQDDNVFSIEKEEKKNNIIFITKLANPEMLNENKTQIISKAKNFIRAGKIEKSILFLMEYQEFPLDCDNDIKNNLLLLQSRLKQIKNKNLYIRSDSSDNKDVAEITNALISLISEI